MDKPAFINRDEMIVDKAYLEWLTDIKQRFQKSQVKAAVQVNRALLEFYWSMGQDLVEKKPEQIWGAGVIKQLSLDLRASFPGVKGFSTVNLYFMRRWYAFYQDTLKICPELFYQAGKISQIPEIFTYVPWRHHTDIISECETVEEALFYIHKTVDNNWSRSVLENNLSSDLYKSQGRAMTNFSSKLPAPQSDLAQSILKDPYNFNFMNMRRGYDERELEDALVSNIFPAGTRQRICLHRKTNGIEDARWQIILPGFDFLSYLLEVLCCNRTQSS